MSVTNKGKSITFTTAAEASTLTHLQVIAIMWCNSTATTDECKVTDTGSGDTLFWATAGVVDCYHSISFCRPINVTGITITTLSAGVVTVVLA